MGELPQDGHLFKVRESILKPLKIQAKCLQGSSGAFPVLFLDYAAEAFLDKFASDDFDVHSSPLRIAWHSRFQTREGLVPTGTDVLWQIPDPDLR